MAPNDLSVGEMAARAGVPVSTIHYYEAEGLIESWRTPSNHRRYDRRELRRVAIARVALTVGVSLKEVKEVLHLVPRGHFAKAGECFQLGLRLRQVERFVNLDGRGQGAADQFLQRGHADFRKHSCHMLVAGPDVAHDEFTVVLQGAQRCVVDSG